MTQTTTIRSRKVRRILRLEARADGQETRHAKAASRAEIFLRRVEALRTEARALDVEATYRSDRTAELAVLCDPRVRAAVAAIPIFLGGREARAVAWLRALLPGHRRTERRRD